MDAFIASRITSASSASTSYWLRGSESWLPMRSSRLKIRSSIQEVQDVHINGTKVDSARLTLNADADCSSEEEIATENLPSLNAVLTAVAALLVASRNSKREQAQDPDSKRDVPMDVLRQGRFVQGRRVYRQTFLIRSYEIGPDRTASIETLMNHFQETALNHVWMSGLAGDGFGTTRTMIKRNLIWVVTRMHVQVERYPAWGDAIEVDTWVAASGKNGMRRDWLVRDYKTGQILARATSTWVVMNKTTRRLSKMPEDVRMEIVPFYLDREAIVNDVSRKITKLNDNTEYIRSGLSPRHGDLDMNQHVNNVKYIGWMMESVPLAIIKGYELSSLTLEYRRECGQHDTVQSLSCIEDGEEETGAVDPVSECDAQPMCFVHLLRMQNDAASEIVRGRTLWRPRNNHD